MSILINTNYTVSTACSRNTFTAVGEVVRHGSKPGVSEDIELYVP